MCWKPGEGNFRKKESPVPHAAKGSGEIRAGG